VEWNDRTGRGAAPLQVSHQFDGGRGGPSNIISSTGYDEDFNTANCIIVCDEDSEVRMD
jgi:hypothetical protein